MAGDKSTDTSTSRSQLNLQDPVETIQWGGNLPSRRRAITGGLSGLAIGMSLPLSMLVPAMRCHIDSECQPPQGMLLLPLAATVLYF